MEVSPCETEFSISFIVTCTGIKQYQWSVKKNSAVLQALENKTFGESYSENTSRHISTRTILLPGLSLRPPQTQYSYITPGATISLQQHLIYVFTDKRTFVFTQRRWNRLEVNREQGECCPASIPAHSRHAKLSITNTPHSAPTPDASWSPETSRTAPESVQQRASWRRIRHHHSDLHLQWEIMESSHVYSVAFPFPSTNPAWNHTTACPVSRVLPCVATWVFDSLYDASTRGSCVWEECEGCRAFHLAAPVYTLLLRHVHPLSLPDLLRFLY